LAAKVQQRLLPTAAPVSNAVELAGVCFPARGVGGDYYDFLPFDNEQIGIAVADVAGKGMSAALLMSTVQGSLRSQVMAHDATTQNTLAGLVANMNLLLCRATGGANYVTFFYAQFDERTRQLTYVNAGHNPPFVLRPQPGGSDWRKLSTGGLFIGAFDHLQYEQETIGLQPGDVLVAYTDGVTEAMNATDEEFGEDRLQAVLAEFALLSAEGIRAAVIERVRAWSAGAPQSDDLTFLVLKVR
jgi:sigma-B regulation protein RsbU (phosphoserine phosphatase)